jgi:hypothetical protein
MSPLETTYIHILKVGVRNRMLKRMFEPKKGDIGGWRKGKAVPLLNQTPYHEDV